VDLLRLSRLKTALITPYIVPCICLLVGWIKAYRTAEAESTYILDLQKMGNAPWKSINHSLKMNRKNNKGKKRKSSSGKEMLQKRNASPNKLSIDTGSEFKKALLYHKSGQIHKAEEIYKRILEVNPNHSDSLCLLGIIAHQTNKNDIAVNLISKAIRRNPGNPIYYSNLGNALKDQGKLVEAISSYQKALEIRPDFAEVYSNMGNVFKEQGKLTEAIHSYQKVLEIKPDLAEVNYNLGNALKAQGSLTKAITYYQKALKVKPAFAEAHNNMGDVFIDQGKLTEAIYCFQKALEAKPDYVKAHNNMGAVFKEQGKLTEAFTYFRKALEFKPDYAEAYNNMGAIFQEQGASDKAISCFQKALKIKPAYTDAYYNMGIAFKDLGKLAESISCLQKALEINPDYAEAYSNLFHQLQQACAWQKLENMSAKLDEFTTKSLDNGAKTAEPPFVSLARHTDLSRHSAIAKSWSSDITKTISTLKIHFPFDGRRSCKTKIIVGYLSNNFRNHALAHLTLSLYGLHNRDEFKIFCYSYGEDDGSYYSTRIRQDCDKFVDIHNRSYIDAARCIYKDQVDILVDLNGYTTGSRLEISALHPAPVQVRYLGLAGTTGSNFFDYIITDQIVTPNDHARYYNENFICLPHCYQINDHTQAISNKDWKRADFGLSENSFVFCSFNQGYKIEPVMFNTWMNILRQVPESVLWLPRGSEITENNLRQEAERKDVKPARLIFSEKLLKDRHLGRLRLADVALDTRIVNGAITTSDALWAGVPVITLQGGSFASRISSSILTATGLPELITDTLDEYEFLAIDLARNPEKLQMIRQKIEKNRSTEPLFDTPGFTRNLERAYKEMWSIFAAGKEPRQIEVVES